MEIKTRARGVLLILILTFIPFVHYVAVTPLNSYTTSGPQLRANKSLEDQRKYPMLQLDWAKMRQRQFQDTFAFISAYYDCRVNAAGRPAVVVLTYVNATVAAPELRCLYLYSNGSRRCVENQVAVEEVVDCFARPYAFKPAIFKHILCPLDSLTTEVPAMLQLSSSVNCKNASLSDPIKVRSHHLAMNKQEQSKIGVCVHSSLRGKGANMLQTVRNFISMSTFLGAGFVTMYASPTQVSSEVIASLLSNYSDVVNLVGWRTLDYDYNGQFGIIHDCLYRHMGEAQYLAFIDLDEMVLPMRHLNWLEMLEDLETKAGTDCAGYSFLNRMYKRSKEPFPGISKCSKIQRESVYLSYLNERRCIFRHGIRSKVIVSSKHALHVGIHSVCKLLGNKKLFLVNKDMAISAHYRRQYLHQCLNFSSVNKRVHLERLLRMYVNTVCPLQSEFRQLAT